MADLLAYLPLLARGALVTASLAVLSLALATALGGLAAAGRIRGGLLARSLCLAYTTLVRGVPELVVLLLVYFGGQRLLNAIFGALGLEPITLSTFWAGVVSIGFIFGAYLAETFRGAWLNVPRGQSEAARALGLHALPRLLRVVLPQLVRFALPGYANVWQVLVKATALVSVIGLQDIVGLADSAGKTTREPFLFFVAVLGFYLFITWVSTTLFERAERAYGLADADAR